MKRNGKKLTLHRETVRELSSPALAAAVAGNRGTNPCTNYVTCAYTVCANCTVTCATCETCLTCAGC
ncbi:MAG TPA: hypothetical protein VMW75_13655 [Thermoanaerobaculia bacterium]|nr:hypothetical protein [Thermoanaerobaculia bacterium]